MKTNAVLKIGLVSLVLFYSCQEESLKTPKKATVELSRELNLLVDAGFDPETIQDFGSYFLVEGDIAISKESLLSTKSKVVPRNGRVEQWTNSVSGIAGYIQRCQVSIRIDPSAEQWRDDITAAVGFWNNVADTRVNLYITNGNWVDIIIRGSASPLGSPTAFGAAFLPSNNNTGTTIELNSTPNFIPAWRIRTTIAHEIGHTLGFLHTDSPGPKAVIVPGSPSADSNSIMNSGSAPNRNDPNRNDPVSLWPGFSTWDYLSIQILYPEDYSGDRLYSSDFYHYGNQDVVNAYTGDPVAIRNHWQIQGGPIEGRSGSPLFDVDYYRTTHSDFVAIGMTRQHAISHWLNTGSNEGRASSPLFDVNFYLTNNADLLQAFGTRGFQKAYHHWLTTGINEGRVATPLFNVRNYLQRYSDLSAAFGTDYRQATYHWFFYGRREGRIGT